MRLNYPEYYKEFVCIGSRCPETCCMGWQIAIDETALKKYKKAALRKDGFGLRLRKGIDFQEGCFRVKDSFCPFLNTEGLCDIYIELGEKALCRTCRTYPRHREDYGRLQEWGLSLSCPEAARIILNVKDRQRFLSVKKEGQEGSMEGVPAGLLKKLIRVRKKLLHILQNRTLPLSVRAAMILNFVHEIQRCLEEDRTQQIDAVIRKYEDSRAADSSQKQLEKLQEKEEERFLCMKNYMAMFQELEVVIERWPGFIKDCIAVLYHPGSDYREWGKKKEEFLSVSCADEIAGEQILVYFIYTYFLGAVYDEQAEAKVKLAVLSWLMIREAAMAGFLKRGAADRQGLIEAAYLYSREVEHSDHNLEVLEQILIRHPMFSLEKFLTLLAG